MDSSGRLVVPKPIRERAGLRPGDALEISAEEGRVEIRIAPLEVEIVLGEDGLPLARAKEPVPPLTEQEVRETLDAVRSRNESG